MATSDSVFATPGLGRDTTGVPDTALTLGLGVGTVGEATQVLELLL